LTVCLHLKMEFRSCARGREWCSILHYHWWTASIKPRLLFSHSGLVSWGLPFLQFNKTCVHCQNLVTHRCHPSLYTRSPMNSYIINRTKPNKNQSPVDISHWLLKEFHKKRTPISQSYSKGHWPLVSFLRNWYMPQSHQHLKGSKLMKHINVSNMMG